MLPARHDDDDDDDELKYCGKQRRLIVFIKLA